MQKSEIIDLICLYCCRKDLRTYDPYDVWQTSYGIYFKNLYNKYPRAALPFAAFITLWDTFINNRFRFLYKRKEYAIVRAISALSLINLYQYKPSDKVKNYINLHIEWLISNSVQINGGIGWGLPFVWPVSKEIVYPANTPFSTHTPYAFEAIYRFNEIFPQRKNVEILHGIYIFYEKHIKILYEDNSMMAVSYGPMNDRIAINASSYTLLMYAYFLMLFPDKYEYLLLKIRKLHCYIKYFQGSEGEWYYSPDKETSFIDCFHSCFIVQNLTKAKKLVPEHIDDHIIVKGWNYIRKNFYDQHRSLFKRFTVSNKPGLIKFDLYDNAEVLNTAILLKDTKFLIKLNKSIIDHFVKGKDIYSAITFFNKRINKNMLRWAIVPLIYCYSKMLLEKDVWNSGIC